MRWEWRGRALTKSTEMSVHHFKPTCPNQNSLMAGFSITATSQSWHFHLASLGVKPPSEHQMREPCSFRPIGWPNTSLCFVITSVLETKPISSTPSPKVFLSKIQQACHVQLSEWSTSATILNSPVALQMTLQTAQLLDDQLRGVEQPCIPWQWRLFHLPKPLAGSTWNRKQAVTSEISLGRQNWTQREGPPFSGAEWNEKLVVHFLKKSTFTHSFIRIDIYGCIRPHVRGCAPATGHMKRVRGQITSAQVSVASAFTLWVISKTLGFWVFFLSVCLLLFWE